MDQPRPFSRSCTLRQAARRVAFFTAVALELEAVIELIDNCFNQMTRERSGGRSGVLSIEELGQDLADTLDYDAAYAMARPALLCHLPEWLEEVKNLLPSLVAMYREEEKILENGEPDESEMEID